MERFWSREGTGAVAGTAAGACAKAAAREARIRIGSRMGILQSISILTMSMQAPVEVDSSAAKAWERSQRQLLPLRHLPRGHAFHPRTQRTHAWQSLARQCLHRHRHHRTCRRRKDRIKSLQRYTPVEVHRAGKRVSGVGFVSTPGSRSMQMNPIDYCLIAKASASSVQHHPGALPNRLLTT